MTEHTDKKILRDNANGQYTHGNMCNISGNKKMPVKNTEIYFTKQNNNKREN